MSDTNEGLQSSPDRTHRIVEESPILGGLATAGETQIDPEVQRYMDMLNPGIEFNGDVESAAVRPQGAQLEDAGARKIREEVAKNIDLSKMYGSSNFNIPKK